MCYQQQVRQVALALVLGFWILPAHGDKIELPEEELATETVLPVFENVEVVKNRTIQTAGRFEFGGGSGLSLNEAFYNNVSFYALGSYHFNETHGLNVMANFFMDGLSSYGEQLQSGEGLTGKNFDPSLAPSPTMSVIGNYQFTAFYGKISLSKKTVMNLSLFGNLGVGTMAFDGVQSIALNAGFGQKFYFTKNVAFRMDLRALIYEAPDPTTVDLDTVNNPTLSPEVDQFDSSIKVNTLLNLGLVILI